MSSPILEYLPRLEAALVARGFPAMSAWWRGVFEEFYGSGRRELVLRVGRRGGKSSSIVRLLVLEALYGEHTIPPGDVGVIAIISERREQAADRLKTVRSILDALGVPYETAASTLKLPALQREFRVYTCSIGAVSGFTCIAAFCDEVAKWRDNDTGANPASEVLASLRPCLSDQRNAKLFLSSSPIGLLDAHAKHFAQGDVPPQLARWAPTWVARPSLPESETRQLERREDVWRREYGAIPMEGSEASLLSAALLDRAQRADHADVPREKGVTYVAAMDPAYVQNGWTLAIAARRMVGARIKRSIVAIREWRGSPERPLEPEAILAEIALVCRRYGVERVETDAYQVTSLRAIAARPEINLHVYLAEGGAVERLGRYEALLTWLSDGEIEIPNHAQLRADLLAIRQRLTANGFTITLPETPDGRHADFAPSAVLALCSARFDPVLEPAMLSPAEAMQERLRRDEEAMWAAQRRKPRPGMAGMAPAYGPPIGGR